MNLISENTCEHLHSKRDPARGGDAFCVGCDRNCSVAARVELAERIALQAAEAEGAWVQTFTGRMFFPLAPRAEDVDIEDIAHALSQLCRFTGHTNAFYSVADHSCRVAQLLLGIGAPSGLPLQRRLELARWGLLHDASEAYLVREADDLRTDLEAALEDGDSADALALLTRTYIARMDRLVGR